MTVTQPLLFCPSRNAPAIHPFQECGIFQVNSHVPRCTAASRLPVARMGSIVRTRGKAGGRQEVMSARISQTRAAAHCRMRTRPPRGPSARIPPACFDRPRHSPARRGSKNQGNRTTHHQFAIRRRCRDRGIARSPSRACVACRHTTGGVRGEDCAGFLPELEVVPAYSNLRNTRDGVNRVHVPHASPKDAESALFNSAVGFLNRATRSRPRMARTFWPSSLTPSLSPTARGLSFRSCAA